MGCMGQLPATSYGCRFDTVQNAHTTHQPRNLVLIRLHALTPKDWPTYRHIRLAALRDAPDAFGATYADEAKRTDASWQQQLLDTIGQPNIAAAWLAWQQDAACGLAWCALDGADARTAHLYQMWVQPSARHVGTGSVLLQTAMDWAKAQKAAVMELGVNTQNASAIRFYERYGFAATSDIAPLRAGSDQQIQTMRLQFLARNC